MTVVSARRANPAEPCVPPCPILSSARRCSDRRAGRVSGRMPRLLDKTLGELKQPVTALKGVGERRAEAFARLGLRSLSDLLYFLPRRHDDYRQVCYIGKLEPGMQATVIGEVEKTGVRLVAGGRRDFHLTLQDESGQLDAVFFRPALAGQPD